MGSSQEPKGLTSRFRSVAVSALFIVLALVILAGAGVLLVRIIFSPVEIGTPATESEALIRSNERLLQMVQWTVSTVLLIGGGLIGLNWYSNEQRYRTDRANDTRRIGEVEDSIGTLRAELLKFKFETLVPLGQLRSSLDDLAFSSFIAKLRQAVESGNHSYIDIYCQLFQDVTTSDSEKRIMISATKNDLGNNSGPLSDWERFIGLDQTMRLVEVLRSQQLHDEANELERAFRARMSTNGEAQ